MKERKSKPKKCPLLLKHGLPATEGALLSDEEEFLATLIDQQCPLQVCVFNRSGYLCADDREILLKAEIITDACPKCGAKDKWGFREDIGLPTERITCCHCGKDAYRRRGKLLR